MIRTILLLVLLGGCGSSPSGSPTHEPATVDNPVDESNLTLVRLTERASERLGVESVEVVPFEGTARRMVGGEVVTPPGRVVTVTAPVAGVVRTSSDLVPGAAVHQGEELFRLVPLATVDRDTRARATREVEAARATLAAAEARLARTQALAQGRAGSQRAIEEATASRDIAQADVDAALSRMHAMQSAPLLSDVTMRVTSPEDGIVRGMTVGNGQPVAAGAALVEVVASHMLWVKVPVASGDIHRVDREATALVESLSGAEGTGDVEAEPVTGPPTAAPLSGTVDRYYALDASSSSFVLGERVLVGLPLRQTQSATSIPFSAVFYDPTGTAWVYVSESSDTYRRARVDVLRREGDVAVLARGPEIGTRVVSVGAAELYGSEFEPGH